MGLRPRRRDRTAAGRKGAPAHLSREACSEIQGYLLGKPLPIEDYDDVVGRGVKASTFKLRLAG
jgi:hypothetical protein